MVNGWKKSHTTYFSIKIIIPLQIIIFLKKVGWIQRINLHNLHMYFQDLTIYVKLDLMSCRYVMDYQYGKNHSMSCP